MKPGTPPAAPDPVKTAEASLKTNVGTATAQNELNNVNQYTPQGSNTFEQIGYWSDGTPKFSQTTTLSPTEQKLYDQQSGIKAGVNDLTSQQVSKLTGLLGNPVSLNNDAVEARLFDLGSKRLDPAMQRAWNERETELMNRGMMPGSEGYAREQDAFNRSRTDAYNQLALTGRAQSVQEALAERNQPINEITALMSAGQVSMPNFVSTAQANVAPTDYAQLAQNQYMGQMAGWNANNQYNQALMGGLFGLGGAALGAGGKIAGGGGFGNPFGVKTFGA